MLVQPRLHVRLFMRAVVVHHQVQLQLRGKLSVQAAQKFQPLLMPMAAVALSNHLAVQHVERYTKEILGDAEEIYAARKQEGPSATLLDILDVQRAYNEVFLDYFNALREQAQALIDLERTANIWDVDF